MKQTQKNKPEDMSTTNYVVEIKPYSITELSALYNVSNRTMKNWITPHNTLVGEKDWQALYSTASEDYF